MDRFTVRELHYLYSRLRPGNSDPQPFRDTLRQKMADLLLEWGFEVGADDLSDQCGALQSCCGNYAEQCQC